MMKSSPLPMRGPFSRRTFLGYSAAAISVAGLRSQAADGPRTIRIGMVGLDTSHVTIFARHFNGDNSQRPQLQNLRVTAAFPGGNAAFPLSKNRVDGFTKEVRELGVEIVPSLGALLPLVDAVLLESVDGTQHLEQAIPVFEAGKPLFIDKPLAASLRDVLAIAELGRKHDVPWFAASSSRFTPGYPELRNNDQVGQILGCDVYSQSRAAAGHPDLFWYAVHGVDLLYSLLGTGCQSVTAVQTQFSEHVSGTWKDGRLGTYRAIREHTGKTGLGATVFGTKGIVHVDKYYDYFPLVVAIGKFFRSRQSPVPVNEMVEIFAYMAAADESKQRRGVPVALAEVVEAARAKH